MQGEELEGLYAGTSAPALGFGYIAAIVFLALPLAVFIGYRVGRFEYGRRQYANVSPEMVPGGTSLGAMLALLGLLLGFAFSSSLGSREARQDTLVQEAIAMSTAFLTADLLEDAGRTNLQTAILSYARTRLATPADVQTAAAWNAFLSRTLEAQSEVWPTTLRAIEGDMTDTIRVAVVRAVTDMLDAHTYRIAAETERLPPLAKLMLLIVAIVTVFIVGNRAALQGRELTWRTFVFAIVLAVIMIIITDLDRPLEGMITLNADTLLATIHEMETALADRLP